MDLLAPGHQHRFSRSCHGACHSRPIRASIQQILSAQEPDQPSPQRDLDRGCRLGQRHQPERRAAPPRPARPLRSGDTVRVGRIELVYLDGSETSTRRQALIQPPERALPQAWPPFSCRTSTWTSSAQRSAVGWPAWSRPFWRRGAASSGCGSQPGRTGIGPRRDRRHPARDRRRQPHPPLDLCPAEVGSPATYANYERAAIARHPRRSQPGPTELGVARSQGLVELGSCWSGCA